MANSSKLTKGLQENLLAILSGTHTHEQLNSFIALCHSMARIFLAKKAKAGILTVVSNLNTSDLAYDCIAELFQQDDGGKYIQLRSYFNGLQLSKALEEEIIVHLRRLVFSLLYLTFVQFGTQDCHGGTAVGYLTPL